MQILNIIPAALPKKAVFYDPVKDELVTEIADVIALIEVENPDNPRELVTVTMYMTCDNFGVYFPPQLNYTFIEFTDARAEPSRTSYKDPIKYITGIYKSVKDQTELVEVKKEDNVSYIKRIIKPKIKETKDEN